MRAIALGLLLAVVVTAVSVSDTAAGKDLLDVVAVEHPAVSTVIPGMRKLKHVEENIRVSDGQALPSSLLSELRKHRWDRTVDYIE